MLSRPGMSLTQFERICAHQMPDRDKRTAADFIISTGLGKADTFAATTQLVGVLRHPKGRAWVPGRSARKMEAE